MTTGYVDCACRDCFEIAIGTAGESFCHDCEEAGCELNAECQSEHAYGGDETEVPMTTTTALDHDLCAAYQDVASNFYRAARGIMTDAQSGWYYRAPETQDVTHASAIHWQIEAAKVSKLARVGAGIEEGTAADDVAYEVVSRQRETRDMEITITNERIERLQAEANAARDYVQEALCELALDGAYDRGALAANGGVRDDLRRLDDMTQAEAMAECERVIRSARDQEAE